jgi:amino-acid N-acetyltransferase
MGVGVEPARGHDLGSALELLSRVGLATEGVADHFGHYLVIREDADLVGIAGLELHEPLALLRSVAVDPALQGEGLGTQLVRACEDLARRLGIEAIYLLTTTAQRFFQHLGYEETDREEAPTAIRESWDFQVGCPKSAVLMSKALV